MQNCCINNYSPSLTSGLNDEILIFYNTVIAIINFNQSFEYFRLFGILQQKESPYPFI